MGAIAGNKINVGGLVGVFDNKSEKCKQDLSTSWKIYNTEYSGESFTIVAGIYDAARDVFVTDGSTERVNIPKSDTTEMGWGKTLSMYLKPETNTYIYNDSSAILVYFSENKKPQLLVTSPNHRYSNINTILIKEDNTIYVGDGGAFSRWYWKLNTSNEIISIRRDVWASAGYQGMLGKWVENNGEIWGGCYMGYFRCDDPVTSENNNYRLYNGTYANVNHTDIDVDADYVYIVGQYYVGLAYKMLKTDYTQIITFGTGAEGHNIDQLYEPSGIAAGTNYVFVADKGNHRIVVLDKSDMTYVTQLGELYVFGSDSDHFNIPYGAVVNDGILYVSDFGNNRIKMYNETTLSYIDSFDVGVNPYAASVNSTYIAVIGSYHLKLYNKSTKALIFDRTFTTNVNFNSYNLKCLRTYGDNLFAYDRSDRMFIFNNTDMSYQGPISIYTTDSYDIAVDDGYYYTTPYDDYIFRKIDRVTPTTQTTFGSQGTGDGQFGAGGNYGIAVDDSYIYCSDYMNSRIQLFNKSDLTYYTQFGSHGGGDSDFRNPRGIEIYDGKIYICDYSNARVKIYNQRTLAYITSISVSNPLKVRIYNNRIYVMINSYQVKYFDINTYAELYSKSFPAGQLPHQSYGSMNMELFNDKLYIAHNGYISVYDADTLSFEYIYVQSYYSHLVNQSIEDDKILVDIVLTDDYKIKMYVNGVESDERTYPSDFSFVINNDMTLGGLRTNYSNTEYYWFGWYNKARTLKEHTEDYNNLKRRFKDT